MSKVIDLDSYRKSRAEEDEGESLHFVVGLDETNTCVMVAICDSQETDEAVVLGLTPEAAVELGKAIIEMANCLSN